MRHIELLLAVLITMFLMNSFVFAQDTTLTVSNNGNVGIGTTTPIAPLHITPNSTSYALRIDQGTSGDGILSYVNTTSSSQTLLAATSNVLGLYVKGNGKVGIGTTSPASRLDVIANGATKIDLRTSSTTEPIFHRFFHSTNIQGGAVGFDTDDNVLKLVHGGNFDTSTKGLMITSDGNVGIGTTTPIAPLHITPNSASSALRIDQGTSGDGILVYVNTTSSEKTLLTATSNVVGLHVKGNGSVGIGTTSPSFPLEMGSGAHVTTGGVWTDASSRQYKENISNLTQEEAIDALATLNPVKFNYKAEKDEEYVGFIAEDVPDLVATKDRKSLSPMDIVAVLTKVVQQQQSKIAELEARLNAGQ